VRLKRANLRLQTRANALRFDPRGKVARRVGAHPDLQPDDADQASALERPNLAQAELEARQRQLVQPPGDPVHNVTVDAAHKPDRQVQVPGRRPPKLGRRGRARREVWLQPAALRLGHRQPEERANLQRCADFFQFAGAQPLGEVGRQP
jgi:hypothetical protein